MNMNLFKLSAFISLLLSACGQTSEAHSGITLRTAEKADTTIYQRMLHKVCDCTSRTMRDNKPAKSLDSCYNVVVQQYTKRLKQQGVDPATPEGSEKLRNETSSILYFECRELSKLLLKEQEEEEAKRLIFTGPAVAEKRLPDGNYEIVIQDSKTKARKTFKSGFPIIGSTIVKIVPGTEINVEYEIKHNNKTNKDEYHVINAWPVEPKEL